MRQSMVLSIVQHALLSRQDIGRLPVAVLVQQVCVSPFYLLCVVRTRYATTANNLYEG